MVAEAQLVGNRPSSRRCEWPQARACGAELAVVLGPDRQLEAPAAGQRGKAASRPEPETANHAQSPLVKGTDRHRERRRGELAAPELQYGRNGRPAQSFPGQVRPQAAAGVQRRVVLGAARNPAVCAERPEADEFVAVGQGVEAALRTGNECNAGARHVVAVVGRGVSPRNYPGRVGGRHRCDPHAGSIVEAGGGGRPAESLARPVVPSAGQSSGVQSVPSVSPTDRIARRLSPTVVLTAAEAAAKPSIRPGPTTAATGPITTKPAEPSAYEPVSANAVTRASIS